MSDTLTVTIDGEEYETEPGANVLDVCRENDIFIPTLCELEQLVEPFGGCRVCLAEVENGDDSEVTTTCDTPVQDGMEITTASEEIHEARKMSLELLLSEHTGDCIAPCSIECPASTDVQGYLAHIANGRPQEAVKSIKQKTPLAVSLGRACFAPCEDVCRREMVEEPMAIRQLKMYAAEKDLEDPWTPEIPEATGKTVGVVGGGPAGLTAAYFLRLEGHDVTIYDMMPELGGMMRYGIPNYRLPKDLLDEEIEWILDLGIEAETEVEMGEDVSLEELRDQHDSVFVATGAWNSWAIPIEGSDLPGVYGGIDFLIDHTQEKDLDLGEKVAVVGCGNTAMDVARTAKRLGKEVEILYRRTEEQAPAEPEEIEHAKEEGIEFTFLASPSEICGDEEEGIEKVICSCMELGEPDESGRRKPVEIPDETTEVEADTVVLAIGQEPDLDLLESEGLEKDEYTLGSNEKFQTNFEDVFTAGDALIGASSIVECTGQGREAAYAVDAFLEGELDDYEVPEDYTLPFGYVHEDEVDEEDFADYNREPRIEMPVRDPEVRVQDFDQVELGWSDEEAQEEAERCLECGCLDRYDCLLRDYSELYDADQHLFDGFKFDREVDDSHPHVQQEPNKCVLCGSCVRTTEEVHGEGVVQFVDRGFKTVVEPAYGDPLGDTDSKLVGDLADACPTGALEEVLDDVKPGPHETEKAGETHCVGCSLTCPAEIHSVNGRPVMLKPAADSEYGHLCDIGKFETLPEEFEAEAASEDVWENVEELLGGKGVDVVVGTDATTEEAERLVDLADSADGVVTADIPDDGSTSDLDDLLSAEALYVDEAVYETAPIMKTFVNRAKQNGTTVVTDPDDLGDGVAVVRPESDTDAQNRIVVSAGPNVEGLRDLGIESDALTNDTVIVYGDCDIPVDKLEGKDVIHFSSGANGALTDETDITVPINSWVEKDGTMSNAFREERALESVAEARRPSNLDVIDRVIELA